MIHKRPNARGYRPHHPYRLDENGKVNRLYRIWIEMRSRCMNPKRRNYPWYGGKGVTVCKEWDEYINFHNDMSESYYKHYEIHGAKDTTIDRIDNKKGYSRENCQWSTRIMQGRNQKTNVFITYLGETKTISAWAEKLNIKYITLYSRIFVHKFPIDKAFNLKVSKKSHKK